MAGKISGTRNICKQICPVIQGNKNQGNYKAVTFLEELK
jgi:hypothetical protein